jgi:acylphosphatase
MKRLRIRVFGDVQGVFFRHYAMDMANKLGVKGWIRNDPDGSVFIVAEGEESAVDKFAEWAKNGSPMATVDTVDINIEEYVGDSETFEIR